MSTYDEYGAFNAYSAEILEEYDNGAWYFRLHVLKWFCLFVLRFYGPVNPMGS